MDRDRRRATCRKYARRDRQSARLRFTITEVKEALALGEDTGEFTAADLCGYYAELFGRPVEALDETTAG
jgi:hypothetical protein